MPHTITSDTPLYSGAQLVDQTECRFTKRELDPAFTAALQALWETDTIPTDQFMRALIQAKESILKQVLSIIEHRPAVVDDANYLELIKINHDWETTYVRYKGVDVGYIKIDIERQVVFFTPQ